MLYQILATAFAVIVLLSNIISAKMISLPFSDLPLPVGLITYPLTFLISDFITEIYGSKKAKHIVYMAFGMNLLAFCILQVATFLPAYNIEEQVAFAQILGLSGIRIFSSLIAFLIAQITDIQSYTLIKKWTGPKQIWLRNNGSTCLSQLIDTIVIDLIFLFWGLKMPLNAVILIILISYSYKVLFSLLSTPLFYLSLFLYRKKVLKNSLA